MKGRTMAIRQLNVNRGVVYVKVDDPDMPLLYVLHDELVLRGPVLGAVMVSAARARSKPRSA
jgi:aerobic-type carbon monoxide dehydrogenase small subunit (CoxS/CutS family)